MDFSSVRRALESLERRQPPLSDECLAVVNRVRVGLLAEIGETASEEDLLASVQELLTTEYITASSNNNEDAPPKIRWEPLAVALLVSTELLQNSCSGSKESSHYQHDSAAASVYMDGPRMLVVDATNATVVPRLSTQADVVLCPNGGAMIKH